MSTTYHPTPDVSLERVLASLPEGIKVFDRKPVYSVPCAVLTDGTYYLHVYEIRPGVAEFERFGGNRVGSMLTKLGGVWGCTWTDDTGLPARLEDA